MTHTTESQPPAKPVMAKPWRKSWIALGALAAAVLIAATVGQTKAELADEAPHRQIGVLRELLGVLDQYHKTASDPSATAIAALMGANDTLKNPKASIEFLSKVRPKVKDPATRRAITFQLADAYKKTGDNEKALAEFEKLITGAAD